jgi:hypothetical protein
LLAKHGILILRQVIQHANPEAKGSNPTTGKSHGKKPDRFSLNDDTDMKKVLRFKYATWIIRELGQKEKLDKILNKNNIKISVITESKKQLQGTRQNEHHCAHC